MTARVLQIHAPGGRVIPFRPRQSGHITTVSDPGLPAAVHLLAVEGRISRHSDQMIQRGLVCPDDEVWEARLGTVITIAYEYGWGHPDAAHVMALVLLEICPGFTPARLMRLFQLVTRAQTRHEHGMRDAQTAVILAEMRVVVAEMVAADDNRPGAA